MPNKKASKKGKSGKRAPQTGGKKNPPKQKQVPSILSRRKEVRQGSMPIVRSIGVPRPYMRITQHENGSLNGIRIVGQDVITAVSSQTSFTSLFSAAINPLNNVLFPKLSEFAALFEKWRVGKGGLRFKFCAACPTVTPGVIAGYVETDPADTLTPDTTVVAVMNEEISASSPVFEDCSFVLPEGVADGKWLYTQSSASSEPEADRTAFAGIVNWYAENGASGNLFIGYLVVEYDVDFVVFRPPTSSGFSLGATLNQTLTSTVSTGPVKLSDDNFFYNLGATAARYLYSAANFMLASGSDSSIPYSDLLFLNENKTTGGVVTAYMGAATSSRGSEKQLHENWILPPTKSGVSSKSRPCALQSVEYRGGVYEKREFEEKVDEEQFELESGPTYVESFLPYKAIQAKDGSWMYQWYPDGPVFPYQPNTASRRTPLAVGDVTVYFTSVDKNGTQVVLYQITLNSVSAFAVNLAYSVFPTSVAGFFMSVVATFTTARSLVSVSALVGPALHTNS